MLLRSLVISLLFAVGAFAAVAQEPCKRSNDAAGHHSLCPPAGWQVNENSGGDSREFVGPKIDNAAPSIGLHYSTVPGTTSEYAQMGIDHFIAHPDSVQATTVKLIAKTSRRRLNCRGHV